MPALVVTLVLTGAAAGIASAAAAAGTVSTVTVVNAIKGLDVDVYLGGTLLVRDLKPGQISGPLAPVGYFYVARRARTRRRYR